MNNTLDSKISYALKPDAQPFDEIRLKVVPRFKQSGLSGDEWRISVTAEFSRKGKLIQEVHAGPDMERACGMLFHKLMEAQDSGNAYFGGAENGKCDQEGCSKEAEFLYRIRKAYDDRGKRDEIYDGYHRQFCKDHNHRGDSSLGDNDSNYELITVL